MKKLADRILKSHQKPIYYLEKKIITYNEDGTENNTCFFYKITDKKQRKKLKKAWSKSFIK